MANKYSYYQLRVAWQQRMMASLYVEQDDPDAYNAGFVEALTHRHVLLWSLTPWGQPDGWILRRTEDILQVFMGDDYEIRLQLLLEMQGYAFTPLLEKPPEEEGDLLMAVMQLAQGTGEVVSVMVGEETYTGRIVHLDDLRVTLDVFDFFGTVEAQKAFPLRDVQFIALRTCEEIMFTRLNEERLKLL